MNIGILYSVYSCWEKGNEGGWVGWVGFSLSLLPFLPTKAKDIVFRFIIDYTSFKNFLPLGNNNRSIFFDMRIFER
jgi:hypothetical protein